MNTRILLLVAGVSILTSCSTAYKSGQTPDDVYYSPGKERAAYVSTNNREDRSDGYTDVSSRYLRMKAANRNRWSAFDDDYLYWNDYRWNNPYMLNSWYGGPMSSLSFGYGMGYGMGYYGMGYGMGYGHMGYGGYYGYNSFYNPWIWNNPFGSFYYGNPVIILNPKPAYRNPVANGPRVYNLNTYSNSNRKGYNEYNSGRYNPRYSGSNAPVRVFGNTSSGSGAGRGGRYINTNSNSNSSGRSYNNSGNSGRNSNPVRTFDNNSGGSRSSGGTSSGSGSGGSAPVRSFPRGGR